MTRKSGREKRKLGYANNTNQPNIRPDGCCLSQPEKSTTPGNHHVLISQIERRRRSSPPLVGHVPSGAARLPLPHLPSALPSSLRPQIYPLPAPASDRPPPPQPWRCERRGRPGATASRRLARRRARCYSKLMWKQTVLVRGDDQPVGNPKRKV
jgi:hypothetical protein